MRALKTKPSVAEPSTPYRTPVELCDIPVFCSQCRFMAGERGRYARCSSERAKAAYPREYIDHEAEEYLPLCSTVRSGKESNCGVEGYCAFYRPADKKSPPPPLVLRIWRARRTSIPVWACGVIFAVLLVVFPRPYDAATAGMVVGILFMSVWDALFGMRKS